MQSQVFLENGTRIPVTHVQVLGNKILGIKTKEKHGYSAIQLGIPDRKKMFVRETRLADAPQTPLTPGLDLKPQEIFKPGDIINVIGLSKGKGYAGGVKRHHFKGGPKTHGQSDRQRAPGAIGTTTTPGRVYKGKRMAGRMGYEKVTVKNLMVVAVSDSEIFVKGLIPGHINSFVVMKKVGESKNFTPIYKEIKESEGTASNAAEAKGTEVAKVEVKTEAKKEGVQNAS